MSYSFLVISAYACCFWWLHHYAVAMVCLLSLPFFVMGVRVTWKDWAFLAVLVAAYPAHSGNLAVLAKTIGLGWALSFFAQNAQMGRGSIPTVFLVSSGAMAAIMLCQVSPGTFSFDLHTILSRNRSQGWWLFGDTPAGATNISSVIMVAICGAFGLGRIKLLLLPVLYGTLVLACGRTAMVAGGAVLVLYVAAIGRVKAAILVVVGLAFSVPFLDYLKGHQTAGFSDRLESMAALDLDDSMNGRLEFWRNGVDLALSDAGGYGYEYFRDLQGVTLHNEYLAQVVGGGWLAGTLFCCILAGLAWTAGRNLVRNPSGPNFMVAGIILTGGLLGLTENWSLSSASFFYPFFWLSAGLVLNPSYTNNVPPENSTVRNMQHAYVRNRTWRPRIYVPSGPEKKILELPDLTLNQLVSGSSPDRGTSPSSTSEDSPSDPKTP